MVASELPRWAPKIARAKIRLLYQNDAKGLADDELIDDIAFALYERCVSILSVTEAVRGRVRCPRCQSDIYHTATKDEILKCRTCFWELPWSTYKKTYREKQLFGGGAVYAFEIYVRDFQSARTLNEKMLLIDRLIHECHKFPVKGLYTRPAAINLIEGKLEDIILLLGNLAYGESSVEGARDRLRRWKDRVMSAQRCRYGKEIT